MSKKNFLRLPEVMKRTGLKRSSIYTKMEEGTFPKSFKIGKRSAAWTDDDIELWQSATIQAAGRRAA